MKKKYEWFSARDLAGPMGNAHCIMGAVSQAMKDEGKTEDEIAAYTADAMSGDYKHLILKSRETLLGLN